MRNGVALAVLASIPAWADSRFAIALTARADAAAGTERCQIRLEADRAVEVVVRGDEVVGHGEIRDAGSNCTSALPDLNLRGFRFQKIEGPGDVTVVSQPSLRNGFALTLRIPEAGRYEFRLTWNDTLNRPPVPAGFVWNNALTYGGRGSGDAVLNDSPRPLGDVSVNIDLAGKIAVSFAPSKAHGPEPRLLFLGSVNSRDGGRIVADMASEDHRLRGAMTLEVDSQQKVDSVAMNATDGQDHLHLTWKRR